MVILTTEGLRHRENSNFIFWISLCLLSSVVRIGFDMSEAERSLLDAVLENPDDDLPRLVYADYLDENGDPKRAEFIRAQIAIARLSFEEAYDSDEYVSAIRSVSSIEAKDYLNWIRQAGFPFGDLGKVYFDSKDDSIRIRDDETCNQFHFRKGFVEKIIAPEAWCSDNWHSIISHPISAIHFQPPVGNGSLLSLKKTGLNNWKATIQQRMSLRSPVREMELFTKTNAIGNYFQAKKQLEIERNERQTALLNLNNTPQTPIVFCAKRQTRNQNTASKSARSQKRSTK